jgi:glycerophosphoryl diester phosphodiesterase
MTEPRRTYNPKSRAIWADPIRFLVQAVDNHTKLYLETGDPWHEEKARDLRKYINELKTHLIKNEQETVQSMADPNLSQ